MNIKLIDTSKGGLWMRGPLTNEQLSYLEHSISDIELPTPENLASILDCNPIISSAGACIRRHIYNQGFKHLVRFSFEVMERGQLKSIYSVIPFYDKKTESYWRIYKDNKLHTLTIREPKWGYSIFWKDNKTSELNESVNAVLYEIFEGMEDSYYEAGRVNDERTYITAITQVILIPNTDLGLRLEDTLESIRKRPAIGVAVGHYNMPRLYYDLINTLSAKYGTFYLRTCNAFVQRVNEIVYPFSSRYIRPDGLYPIFGQTCNQAAEEVYKDFNNMNNATFTRHRRKVQDARYAKQLIDEKAAKKTRRAGISPEGAYRLIGDKEYEQALQMKADQKKIAFALERRIFRQL